jgi:hypothetical protein
MAANDLRVSAKLLLDELQAAQLHLEALRRNEQQWQQSTDEWLQERDRYRGMLQKLQEVDAANKAMINEKRRALADLNLEEEALATELASANKTVLYLRAAVAPSPPS